MKKKRSSEAWESHALKKLMRTMRVGIFLFFLGIIHCIAADSSAQSAKISLEMKDAKLENVLTAIEQLSVYKFAYNRQALDLKQVVSVRSKDESLEDILNDLFEDTNIRYMVLDNQIILTTEKEAKQGERIEKITGTVTDANGEPLPGVSVVVKGTTVGITTNIDGNYSLDLPEGASVVTFSFVGMKSQEIVVGSQKVINVKLEEDAIGLEEVVAIGYGVTTKASAVGAVSQVDVELIENRPVSKLTDAIQGALPGLTVSRNTGQPGDASVGLQVRGITSVNSSGSTSVGPLVLIDGVEGDINDVNPQDIASFNVLKDAAASIYGSRAAGGVILIETKRGTKERAKFKVSYTQTLKEATYIPRKASPFQYYTMFNEMKTESGQTPLYTEENTFQYLDDPDAYVLVQGNKANFWPERTGLTYRGPLEDIFWDTGRQHIYNITTGGGNDKLSYYVSGSLLDEEGIFAYGPDDFRKYNFRFNLDSKLSKKLKLKSSIGGIYSEKNQVPNVSRVVNNYYGTYVNSPVWNEQGDFYSPRRVLNPIQEQLESGKKQTDHYKVNGNVSLIYDIFKGLQFEGKASVTYDFYNTKTNTKSFDMLGWNSQVMKTINNPNSRRRDYDQRYASTLYGLLRYNRKIEDHNFGIMVGANQDEWDREGFGAWRNNISVQDPFTLNTGNPDEQFNSDWGDQWAIRSYFGRVNYSYKDRYMLEASIRRDGTSRFHSDHRWGNFKSLSLGWRMTEESWFPKTTWLDYAKLRMSYGESGNQNNIGLYDYISDLNINNNPVVIGTSGTMHPSASEGGMVSLEREWETVITYNAGLDVTLFKGLNINFDYFQKFNDDLLLSSEYPSVLGASAPKTNLGKLKTWGWELSMAYGKRHGDFSYNVRVVVSDAKNELVKYGGKTIRKAGTGNIIEGFPINSIFGYEFIGIMNTDEEAAAMMAIENVPQNLSAGDIQVADLDGDGKYTPNGDPEAGTTGDLKYMGSPYPRYNFGVNLNGSWRNFDIGLFFQGVGKRTIYRNDSWTVPLGSTWMAAPEYFFGQTWTAENQDALYPSLDNRVKDWNWQATSLRIENGAYIRLKNVELGYTVPKELTQRIGLEKIRIYASGQDVWEYHKFDRGPDVDPEHGSTFFYPLTRGYSFGVNVTF
ncbi:SusC/RagA family TonB-linked outer membrane protein [Puteibacter caeruleilacunae]|nr:SusC/RagA family TonB-linked outer membrane protein [Puteibacter caeruleilacunae]